MSFLPGEKTSFCWLKNPIVRVKILVSGSKDASFYSTFGVRFSGKSRYFMGPSFCGFKTAYAGIQL